MALQMKIDDEIRINLLEALLKKGSVTPNMRQLKKHTGYHKATIKSSLDFLAKEGVLEGYGPKVNFRRFGYNLEALVLMQADFSQKDLFSRLLEEVKKDPNIYLLSSIIGAGTWNLIARHFYKDVESYYNETQKKYYSAIPGIYNVIRDRQIFYATEPHYKNSSRTESIIKIIKKEKGFS